MTEWTKAQLEFHQEWQQYSNAERKRDEILELGHLCESVMERAEEVATESNRRHGAATVLFDTLFSRCEAMEVRLAALESAAREPATTKTDEPLCANPECGHRRTEHGKGSGVCFHHIGGHYCPCNKFIPPAPPSAEPRVCPRCGQDECCCPGVGDNRIPLSEYQKTRSGRTPPPEPVDPVLFHIAEAYRALYPSCDSRYVARNETEFATATALNQAFAARSGWIGIVPCEYIHSYGKPKP